MKQRHGGIRPNMRISAVSHEHRYRELITRHHPSVGDPKLIRRPKEPVGSEKKQMHVSFINCLAYAQDGS